MTMKKQAEALPLPAEELEALAAHYDTQDTSAEMQHGEWVDPHPMKTISLRLPSGVVDALKALARERGLRYTALVREIIEDALTSTNPSDSQLVQINERLARIEAVVVGKAAPRTGKAKSKKAAAVPVERRKSTSKGGRVAAQPERSVKNAS